MYTELYIPACYTEQVIGVKKKFERKMPEAICCCCLQTCNLIRCHGDGVINMCTEFHIHMCYTKSIIIEEGESILLRYGRCYNGFPRS